MEIDLNSLSNISLWVVPDSDLLDIKIRGHAFRTMMMRKSYFARLCFAAKKESRKGGTMGSSQEEESTLEYLKESRVLSKGQCKVSKSSVERDVLV